MRSEGGNQAFFEWLEALKAFALITVLLNHFVEEFWSGPWFTNPSDYWPDFATRIANVYPKDRPFPLSLLEFFGWLGDSGPGVFILASGIGLTWSTLRKVRGEKWILRFYKKRLARIYPLYICMHLVILAGYHFIPGSGISPVSLNTLLSLLGLRFSDTLFFSISPSWWFVWLIIQLYALFPFLFIVLERLDWKRFLFLTCAFTFVCRFLGILGIRYSDSLYYWMTGIFFGTRLAEFSAGMTIALILFRSREKAHNQASTGRVLQYAFLCYVLGLLCSLTYPGSIVANLLITLGMSGLFYGVWQGVFRKIRVLKKLILWIGLESYGIYLFHNSPLQWASVFFQGTMRFIAAIVVLVASFPVGALLNKATRTLLSILFMKIPADSSCKR